MYTGPRTDTDPVPSTCSKDKLYAQLMLKQAVNEFIQLKKTICDLTMSNISNIFNKRPKQDRPVHLSDPVCYTEGFKIQLKWKEIQNESSHNLA